jgi:hypothetical protein
MTQACCPTCRLRFTRVATAYLSACPQCGEPLQPKPNAELIIGYRLFSPDDVADVVPQAVAIEMPPPAPDAKPS